MCYQSITLLQCSNYSQELQLSVVTCKSPITGHLVVIGYSPSVIPATQKARANAQKFTDARSKNLQIFTIITQIIHKYEIFFPLTSAHFLRNHYGFLG